MADGFDIHVDKDRAEKLAGAARSVGLTPEAYVLSLVDEAISVPSEDEQMAESLRRLDEYDRTGEAYTVDEVFDRIEARIQARMAENG